MEAIVIALIGSGASIAVAVATALILRRRGLPAINDEIEKRTQTLIQTMKDQVKQQADQIVDLGKAFDACKKHLEAALTENVDLRRDLNLTQIELLDLYRKTKTPVPRGLSRRAHHIE